MDETAMKQTQALGQYLQQKRPTLLDGGATYGVLCPLVWREGQWQLLFEVRAATLRRQPGEVCFPGGRMEPGETPVETALRETQEELQLSPQVITVLGELDFIAQGAGFLLHPVLAVVENLEGLHVGAAEVAQVFTVPLSYFQDNPPTSVGYDLVAQVPEDFPYELLHIVKPYAFRTGTVEFPVWVYEGHVIWGMTARIVRQIISLSQFCKKLSE